MWDKQVFIETCITMMYGAFILNPAVALYAYLKHDITLAVSIDVIIFGLSIAFLFDYSRRLLCKRYFAR